MKLHTIWVTEKQFNRAKEELDALLELHNISSTVADEQYLNRCKRALYRFELCSYIVEFEDGSVFLQRHDCGTCDGALCADRKMLPLTFTW